VKLVNETQQEVAYNISTANMADCGTIEVDGKNVDWMEQVSDEQYGK